MVREKPTTNWGEGLPDGIVKVMSDRVGHGRIRNGVQTSVRASVYMETSVPSAYVSERTDPGSLHRRDVTRQWWEAQFPLYEVYTSDSVLLELRQGHWPGQREAIALTEPLGRLEIDEEVVAVAHRYVQERLVPSDLAGDASHLAVACVHGVDFLLTWNIRHLANPNKLDHLTVINRRLGLLTPQVTTPEMLWLEEPA
jgi:hypothetical protein